MNTNHFFIRKRSDRTLGPIVISPIILDFFQKDNTVVGYAEGNHKTITIYADNSKAQMLFGIKSFLLEFFLP
jgi:hypothetical protein